MISGGKSLMLCICCNPNLKLVVTASGRSLSAISLSHLGSTQLYLSYLLSTSDVEYLDEMQVMGKKDKKCSPPAFINTLACVSVKKVFYPSRLIGSSRATVHGCFLFIKSNTKPQVLYVGVINRSTPECSTLTTLKGCSKKRD